MKFVEFPEIHFPVQGIEDVPMPKMVRIRQKYESDKIDDIKGHLINELENIKIDRSALKGKSIGGAKVSEKHAGFIINTGNATTNDILELIKYCQNKVFEKFSVELVPEVRIIGRGL